MSSHEQKSKGRRREGGGVKGTWTATGSATTASTPVEHQTVGRLDTTQVHELYKWHVDALDRRDLEALAALYHEDAIVIANRELSRLTRYTNGTQGADVRQLYTAWLEAGLGTESPWEYVQGTNAFMVRGRVRVGDVEKDTFGYFVVRDGKIWRHVHGVEEERTRTVSAQVDPSRMHPMFGNLAHGLLNRNPDDLLKLYTPDAVTLFAASKSWAFRVRGVAEGHEEIRGFLGSYMEQDPEVAELKDYVEVGDTVYMHGLMRRNGIVSDSYGAYVLTSGSATASADDQIAVGFSTT